MCRKIGVNIITFRRLSEDEKKLSEELEGIRIRRHDLFSACHDDLNNTKSSKMCQEIVSSL